MVPKRKKKVSHAAGEAERRLWQYLAIYITAVLLFFLGSLVRYDLEAADEEQKEVESLVIKTETVKQVTTEKEQEEFCGRRAVNPEECFSTHRPLLDGFIEWLTDPFDRNSQDK